MLPLSFGFVKKSPDIALTQKRCFTWNAFFPDFPIVESLRNVERAFSEVGVAQTSTAADGVEDLQPGALGNSDVGEIAFAHKSERL